MGQQKVKAEALKEGKKKDAPKDEPKEEKKTVVKKWKGKDWFSIMSPKSFGESLINETPTTDPKTLIGRTVEINVGDFFRQPAKYYMKMKFKIDRVEGRNAHTLFNGYTCLNEYISRYIRKGSQKVTSIDYATTKDNWKIQVYVLAILNRNVERGVQKAVRKGIKEYIEDKVKASTMEEFMKAVISGIPQRHVKKTFSKIYPIRFSEIS
ncbi:MAG: hypothetical protein ABIH52_03045, partial [Candidatus Aenigmatarchaeota archaeon]